MKVPQVSRTWISHVFNALTQEVQDRAKSMSEFMISCSQYRDRAKHLDALIGKHITDKGGLAKDEADKDLWNAWAEE